MFLKSLIMKTNSILILAIGFTFLLLTSCKPSHLGELVDGSCEGEDIHLGDLSFEAATNELVPNTMSTASLVFENENGDKIILSSATQIEDNFQVKIEAICGDKDDIFASNVYSFYNSISARETYNDGLDYNISFARSMRVVEASLPEEFLYDEINVNARFGDTYFGNIHLITSLRGNEETFPQDYLEATNSYEYDESIELGGMVYEEVYSSIKTSDYINGKIFITKADGVIGLLDKDNVFWALEK